MSQATLSRKQKEIRLRQDQILQAARRMMDDRGYIGLTMDRIAEEVGWSKPTIYQHYASKEEVIVGLAIENARRRAELYTRVEEFDARPRERLRVLGEISGQVYPQHLKVEILLYSQSIRGKASPELQTELVTAEMESLEVIDKIVQQGVEAGDLALPEGLASKNIVYMLWAYAFGSVAIGNAYANIRELGFHRIRLTWKNATRAMLDGLGWKPLSTEWDYNECVERAYKEVFPEFAPQNRDLEDPKHRSARILSGTPRG